MLLGVLGLALPASVEWGQEDCNDRRDNDADGRVDCADIDCCGAPSCAAILDCVTIRTSDVDADGRWTVSDAVRILLGGAGAAGWRRSGSRPRPVPMSGQVPAGDPSESRGTTSWGVVIAFDSIPGGRP